LAVSFRPEDRVFVQIAIDECRKLNLTKHTPTALIWNSRLPVDQPLLYHSYLMMPEALNGKILPQEARPLIMSAIIQKQRVKRYNPPDRYVALLCVITFVGLIGSIIISVAISKALGLGPLSDNAGEAIVLPWLVLPFVGALLLSLRKTRVRRLECDLRLAHMIGSDILLQTLRKIENLNLSPQHGRILMLMSVWPSLSQRMANLNNPSLPITEKDAFEAFQKKWALKPKP
jgi:hypothetical protein